jgi:hypothetical protein
MLSRAPQWILDLPPLPTDVLNVIIPLLVADSTEIELIPNFGYITHLFPIFLPNWSVFPMFSYLIQVFKREISDYLKGNNLEKLNAF